MKQKNRAPAIRQHHGLRRHIEAPHRTTLLLESAFWHHIDLLAASAGYSWREWVSTVLTDKPDGIGAAGWLRVRCLIESSGAAHG